MKAVVWTAYGPPEVLKQMEVPKPVPKADEVLIRIHATTVTAGDCEMRSLKLPMMLGLPMRVYNGLSKPGRITILGQELSGEVEAVGQAVTRFKPGDQVFATTGFGLGGYAEYICLRENPSESVLALKPANLTYQQAAAVPFGGLEALHLLKQAQLKPGEKILVVGAGGTIGTNAVQLARHFGGEVTAVDRGEKLDMLRTLGAARVIDYTQEDYTQDGEHYDVIFDVIGKSPFSRCLDILNDRGRYLLAAPKISQLLRKGWISRSSSKRIITTSSTQTLADLRYLIDLLESGELKVIIDRTFPLEQAVEAHSYAESGGKKGNLVLTVVPDEAS